MAKKKILLSAKEPKVEVNFSQSLKVTMKIFHKHLKWNIRTSDQKSYPKSPPLCTSNLLKSPSCLCFLARILSNAYSFISVHDQESCSWTGNPSLSLTCGCFWYKSLTASVPPFTKHPLETLCLKLHCVQFKAQRPCSAAWFSRYLPRKWKTSSPL